MYSVNEIIYEGYGTDEQGRTGIFRTRNKNEIESYVRKCNDNNVIYTLKVISIKPVTEYRQQNLFDYL